MKCSLNWLASYEPIQIQTESEEKYLVQIGITITKDSRELLPFPPDGALPVQLKILIRVKFVKRQKWILNHFYFFTEKYLVPRILASFFRFLYVDFFAIITDINYINLRTLNGSFKTTTGHFFANVTRVLKL